MNRGGIPVLLACLSKTDHPSAAVGSEFEEQTGLVSSLFKDTRVVEDAHENDGFQLLAAVMSAVPMAQDHTGIASLRNFLLLLLIPIVTIFIVVSSGQGERQPSWDTGYLDHVDKALFRKALSTDAAPLAFNESLSPPKIAFLFLIRGHMPLEALWVRFLEVPIFLFTQNDQFVSPYRFARVLSDNP